MTDTGRQIEEDLRARYGRSRSELDEIRRQNIADEDASLRERPSHPVAAVGVTMLLVAALVVALAGTSLLFLAVTVAVPLLILAVLLFGVWAFWSYGQKRRARRESSTVPGEAHPDD